MRTATTIYGSVTVSRCRTHAYTREKKDTTLFLRSPQRGITPGQFAAWYDGEEPSAQVP
ncbi:MAG: aminomethyltransferase beta-barrel domain-containing protein [Bacteroidales bacterium]